MGGLPVKIVPLSRFARAGPAPAWAGAVSTDVRRAGLAAGQVDQMDTRARCHPSVYIA